MTFLLALLMLAAVAWCLGAVCGLAVGVERGKRLRPIPAVQAAPSEEGAA